MKKVLGATLALLATAGVSAYAANPFSDVSTTDWAYQAVADLSDQGIVEGYPDGTFKGERNITRYEMAQIIARLMAKEDQLNAEQQATINKLASEYADELANLGVRVSNLEKKVGNISWSGDARMRFNQSYNTDGSAFDKYNGRMRINVKGQVNDKTYVQGRLTSNMNFKDANAASTSADVLYVHHDLSKNVSVDLGRSMLYVGQTSIFLDDYLKGVKLTANVSPALTLEAGYGRVDVWNGGDYLVRKVDGNDDLTNVLKNDDREMYYGRIYGNANALSYDVEYYDVKATYFGASKQKIWGAGLTVPVAKSGFKVFGDYYQNTSVKDDPALYTAGLSFGEANRKKPGTWKLSGQYVKVEKGAYLGGSTYNIDPMSLSINKAGIDAVKYWLVSGDVVLAKNVTLHGEWATNVKTEGTSTTDYDDLAAFVLNYKF